MTGKGCDDSGVHRVLWWSEDLLERVDFHMHLMPGM
jgi:hypothetical protein